MLTIFKYMARGLDPWRWPNGSQPLGTRMEGMRRCQSNLVHTVIPPAKYSTNRGVFCHVTHNRISFSLHLISGSKNQKWLTMSEDLASIWIHFACFSSKIVIFVDR